MHEKVLSCFIDESGDFGSYDHRSPYYIVSIVLHDQKNNISDHIKALDEHLSHHGYSHHALHTGPLIRREADSEFDLMENRKHSPRLGSIQHLKKAKQKTAQNTSRLVASLQFHLYRTCL